MRDHKYKAGKIIVDITLRVSQQERITIPAGAEFSYRGTIPASGQTVFIPSVGRYVEVFPDWVREV